MLKKLYKYELYSLFRNLLPIYAAVLGFALLSRLTLLIKTDNPLLQIPAVMASLLIMGAGTEVLGDIFDALKVGFEIAGQNLTAAQIASLTVEFIIAIIIGMFQSLLMFYAAIAIGQQFKSRVGGAVVAYICLYAAVQVINTFIMVIGIAMFGSIEADLTVSVGTFQAFLGLAAVYSLIFSAAYFCITRHFLSKKLNLE